MARLEVPIPVQAVPALHSDDGDPHLRHRLVLRLLVRPGRQRVAGVPLRTAQT